MTESMNKQCPVCGEYIPKDSEICEFCGEKFINPSDNEDNQADEQVLEENPDESETETQTEEESGGEQNDAEELNLPKQNRSIKGLLIAGVFLLAAISVLGVLFFVSKGIDVSIEPQNKENTSSASHSILHGKSSVNIDKAKIMYQDGNTDEAAQLFQDAIDAEANPVAYYYMGEIYREQGFTKIAIQNYKKALDNKKDFYEPIKRLAEVYLSKGDSDTALGYALRGAKQKPKDVELLKTLANIYYNTDDEDNMLKTYKQIASIDKKDYESNRYLANYYYDRDEYKETVPYFNNLLDVEYDTDLAYTLAMCYAKIEYYTKAMEVLDLIIKKDSSEYYRATSAKSRLAEMKADYNAAHGKNSSGNSRDEYNDEAEDALF